MNPVVEVPRGLSPAETAQWVWDYEQAYAALARSSAGVDAMTVAAPAPEPEGTLDEHAALAVMMARWDQFNLPGAQYRHMLIGQLQEQGYHLSVPDTRGHGTSQRTYLKALRRDGVNAGYLNSSTFTFVKARSVLPAHELVRDAGRYPAVDVNSNAAVSFVARVTAQFASEV